MSGFTTQNYGYYNDLSAAPSAGVSNDVFGASPGPFYLVFASSPATTNDSATMYYNGSPYQVTYLGYTVSGDPIVDYLGDYLLLSNTNYDGLSVTPEANDSFTCYCSGTLILTERGEVPVEDLAIGDTVLTADGGRQPVRWIGHRRLRTHGGRYLWADPLLVNPIRIRAGALGENLPKRDLLLSPEHAILIGDILVQAGALVNGLSILREDRLPDVLTYYHIELAEHALILAEGVAAETFVDNVNRLSFDNWAEHAALIGGPPSIVEMAYPRAQSHRQVPAEIHATLRKRARVLPGGFAA